MLTKYSRSCKTAALLVLLLLITGCGTMKAETGNTVKVDYLGTTDGKVFDTSMKAEAEKSGIYNDQRTYEPLEFELGAGQMIKGFDNAVLGMKIGEEKTVDIPPEDAYGNPNPNQIKEVPNAALSDSGVKPEVGQRLQAMTQTGPIRGVVVKVSENKTTVDFNHELAGKTLTFKIILREIN